MADDRIAGKKFTEIIKGYSDKVATSISPSLIHAEVTSVNPLIIKVEDKEITSDFLEFNNFLNKVEFDFTFTFDGQNIKAKATIDNSMKKGDKVTVIQSDSDGIYYILSKE